MISPLLLLQRVAQTRGPAAQSWQNRAHFFGVAAETMRRILIARARRKHTQRRGAGVAHLDVDELEIAGPPPTTSCSR
jgi:hypothetical protein